MPIAKLAPPLAVTALALALYAPTLGYAFQWDDKVMLVGRSALSQIDSAAELLKTPFRAAMERPGASQPYYRPASLALLWAEKRIFGSRPEGYRAVHGALHLLCCLLVYAALLGVARAAALGATESVHRIAAAFGAGIFAVAPYGVDTVLFLTSVGDLLVVACTAGASLLGVAFLRGRGALTLVAALLLASLAVLSKETGAALPLVFALYALAVGAPFRKGRWAVALVLLSLPALGFAAVRAALVESASHLQEPLFWQRIAASVGEAARFSFAPHPFGMERELSPIFESFPSVGGLALLLFAAAFGLFRPKARRFLWGGAVWLSAFAPSAFAAATTGVLSSRYLYFPAFGVALVAAALVALWGRPARIACLGAVAVFLAFAALRVFSWSSEYRLWAREAELNPERAATLVQLGAAALGAGDFKRAEGALREAARLAEKGRLSETEAYAHSNLCSLLAARGRLDGALAECAAAVRAFPDYAGAWAQLGNLHARDGAWDKALRAFENAMARDVGEYAQIAQAAGAAAALGEREKALRYLERAKAAAGSDPDKQSDLARRRELILKKLAKRAGETR